MGERQLEHHEVAGGKAWLPLSLLLDSVESPANVGALFRLADAMGLAALHLCGTTPCPPNTRLHRAARSTERVVPWHYNASAFDAAQHLKQAGVRLLCLELTSQSRALESLVLQTPEPVCLILGNERRGVAASLLELAGESLHLPMRGQNSSMNVAMAAAMACHWMTNCCSGKN